MAREYYVEFKEKAVYQIIDMVRLESCSLQRAYTEVGGGCPILCMQGAEAVNGLYKAELISCTRTVEGGSGSRTGHLAVGALIEHQADSRSIKPHHLTGKWNHILSYPACPSTQVFKRSSIKTKDASRGGLIGDALGEIEDIVPSCDRRSTAAVTYVTSIPGQFGDEQKMIARSVRCHS